MAGSCAHQSGLRGNLGLASVASYSVQDPCVRSFWIIFVCWRPLAKFFTTSCRTQSFTKFRIVVALHHQQECFQYLRESMLHQGLANSFASHCVWRLSGIFPDCIVTASKCHTQSTVLLLRWCPVPRGAAAATKNLFSIFFQRS